MPLGGGDLNSQTGLDRPTTVPAELRTAHRTNDDRDVSIATAALPEPRSAAGIDTTVRLLGVGAAVPA
jgi:hypothetical protein